LIGNGSDRHHHHHQAELFGENKPGEYGSRANAKYKISHASGPGEPCHPDRTGSQVVPDRLGTDKALKLFGLIHVEWLSAPPDRL
jgi:hypothetical protein